MNTKLKKITGTSAYLTSRFADAVAYGFNENATQTACIYRNRHDGRYTLLICNHVVADDDEAYTATDPTDDLATLRKTFDQQFVAE